MCDVLLVQGLQKIYGRLLGELQWIEAPPRTMNRPSRSRDAFNAEKPIRLARATEIKEQLPHLVYVIHMLAPDWRPEDAKIVRPSKGWSNAPPGGWIGAAMAVLNAATHYITIADIVEEVTRRYDIDTSYVAVRQRLHTAINNSLKRRRDILESDGGKPEAWALKTKVMVRRL